MLGWARLVVLGWALVVLGVAGRAVLLGTLDGGLVTFVATLVAAGLVLVLGRVPRVTVSLLGGELVVEGTGNGRQHLAYSVIEEVTLEEPDDRRWMLSKGRAWRVGLTFRGGATWTIPLWSWWKREALGERIRGLVEELRERVFEAEAFADDGEEVELDEGSAPSVGVSSDAVATGVVIAGGVGLGLSMVTMPASSRVVHLVVGVGWLVMLGVLAWRRGYLFRGEVRLEDGELRLPGQQGALPLAMIGDVRVVEPFRRPGRRAGRDPRLGLAVQLVNGRQERVMYGSVQGREALRRRLEHAARSILAAARAARARSTPTEHEVAESERSSLRVRWVEPALPLTVVGLAAVSGMFALLGDRPQAMAVGGITLALMGVLLGLPWLLYRRRPRIWNRVHLGVDGIAAWDGFDKLVDFGDVERVDLSGRPGLDAAALTLRVVGAEEDLMHLHVQGFRGARLHEQLRRVAAEVERRARVARGAGVAWLEPPEGTAFEQVRWLRGVGAGAGAPYRAGKVSAAELWAVVLGIGVAAPTRVAAAIALSAMARAGDDAERRRRVGEVIVSRQTREAILEVLDGEPSGQARVLEGRRRMRPGG